MISLFPYPQKLNHWSTMDLTLGQDWPEDQSRDRRTLLLKFSGCITPWQLPTNTQEFLHGTGTTQYAERLSIDGEIQYPSSTKKIIQS